MFSQENGRLGHVQAVGAFARGTRSPLALNIRTVPSPNRTVAIGATLLCEDCELEFEGSAAHHVCPARVLGSKRRNAPTYNGYSKLDRAAVRCGWSALIATWYIARTVDVAGSGAVSALEIAHVPRNARRFLREGRETPFWTVSGGRVFLRSLARVAHAMGCDALGVTTSVEGTSAGF